MDLQAVSAHDRIMKPAPAKIPAAIALSLALAGCVPPPAPPVATPAPAPTTAPAAPPLPANPQVHENYLDAPQTPGDWRYQATVSGGIASFGAAATSPVFALECQRLRGVVQLRRPATGDAPATMRIQTETTARILETRAAPVGAAGLVADLAARDPLLDAMAITKGRFAIETEGLPTLYLPAWAEVGRVVEDCR